MTASKLWLRPPSQDEFEQWLPRQEAAYAREIAGSGAMSAAAAAENGLNVITRRFHPASGADSLMISGLVL
jgi:hypothetical protein